MAFKAAVKNIVAKRGDTYDFTAKLERVDENTGQRTPYDLSGFDIKGQVRRTSDSTSVWIDFSNHRLRIINATEGTFGFKILGEDLWNYHPAGTSEPNSGVYDIQFSKNVGDVDNEQIITYVTGTFEISDDVTRNQNTPREIKRVKKSSFVKYKD